MGIEVEFGLKWIVVRFELEVRVRIRVRIRVRVSVRI